MKVKMFKKTLATMVATTFVLASSMTALAAEPIENNVKTEQDQETGVDTRAVSGYGHQYTNGQNSGSFEIVIPSGSTLFGHCSVRFEGFPEGSTVVYRLTKKGSSKIMFPGNADRIWNYGDGDDNGISVGYLSAGTYVLTWDSWFGNSGTIHCHLF